MHTVFTHARICFYMCACLYMDNVASYLPFSLSYNATVLVTLFFPYRALAAHQGPPGRQNRGGSAWNQQA